MSLGPAAHAAPLRVVLMTAPDADTAARVARALVDERLIACANVLPGATSIYRWEGAVHAEPECLVVMKTREALVPRLVERAAELHPYSVPELLALPVMDGLPAYCRWVMDETALKLDETG
ncbi:MAG TPA: divalent-cation tolerance protein CutA [Longimicrobium sp.]|nr:divalent-cation tolerance protein CutA [Longimicrobium sp.]